MTSNSPSSNNAWGAVFSTGGAAALFASSLIQGWRAGEVLFGTALVILIVTTISLWRRKLLRRSADGPRHGTGDRR
jgi:hypothetical protein